MSKERIRQRFFPSADRAGGCLAGWELGRSKLQSQAWPSLGHLGAVTLEPINSQHPVWLISANPVSPYISQCRETAPCPSLSLGWSPASSTAAPPSGPCSCVSSHSPWAETFQKPKELHCQSLDITFMGTRGACSQIKDEAGDPAVPRAPGIVQAASCHPSSRSSLCTGTTSLPGFVPGIFS